MICFSDVSYGRALNGVSFTFDGKSLCIVAPNRTEAEAVADIICGIEQQSLGGVSINCGTVPLITADMPGELKVKELLDGICKAAGVSLSCEAREIVNDVLDKNIGALSPVMKAEVAVAALFATEAEAVFADGITLGLMKNERREILSLMLSVAAETDTSLIYTTESADEVEKSEYVLALSGGKVVFYGKSEDFISRANTPSPLSVRVMGDKSNAASFFEKYGVNVEDDVKKNVYKAVLPPETDIAQLKKQLKGAKLVFLNSTVLDGKLGEIYKKLKATDEVLTEALEEYEEKHAAPRKLELSDFAFNDGEDNEEEDE